MYSKYKYWGFFWNRKCVFNFMIHGCNIILPVVFNDLVMINARLTMFPHYCKDNIKACLKCTFDLQHLWIFKLNVQTVALIYVLELFLRFSVVVTFATFSLILWPWIIKVLLRFVCFSIFHLNSVFREYETVVTRPSQLLKIFEFYFFNENKHFYELFWRSENIKGIHVCL